jgi:hypothetical protein
MRTRNGCIFDFQAVKVRDVGGRADAFDVVHVDSFHLEYTTNLVRRHVHHMFAADKDCSGVDDIKVNG